MLSVQVADQRLYQPAKVNPVTVARDFGSRVLGEESSFKYCIGVAQADSTDAFFSGGYQQTPQRTIYDSVGNTHAQATSTIGCRRHTPLRWRLFVKAATGTISHIVKCSSHRFSLLELRLQLAQATGCCIPARGNTQNALENP